MRAMGLPPTSHFILVRQYLHSQKGLGLQTIYSHFKRDNTQSGPRSYKQTNISNAKICVGKRKKNIVELKKKNSFIYEDDYWRWGYTLE